jgi:hypothetical protein
MTVTTLSLCASCARLNPDFSCAAFPDPGSIPADITVDLFDHRHLYPGQRNDILYLADPRKQNILASYEQAVAMTKAFDPSKHPRGGNPENVGEFSEAPGGTQNGAEYGGDLGAQPSHKPTLWKLSDASAEGSDWGGEYRGTLIRLTRTTDFNVWTGQNRLREKDATDTWWDGYVADGMEGLEPRWGVVAEHYSTRREALARLTRYIDSKIDVTQVDVLSKPDPRPTLTSDEKDRLIVPEGEAEQTTMAQPFIPVTLIPPHNEHPTGISPATGKPFAPGKGPQLNWNATKFSTYPPEAQRAIAKNLYERSPNHLTPEKIAASYEEIYNHALTRHWDDKTETWADGGDHDAISAIHWYLVAHEGAVQTAFTGGVSLRQGVGIVAALSPQMDWDSNIAIAKFYTKTLHDDLAANSPLAREHDSRKVAHQLRLIASRAKPIAEGRYKKTGEPMLADVSNDDNIEKAVRIFRGEDPDVVLGGHKVRSFFNSIAQPTDPDDVTIDTHMVAAGARLLITANSPYMKPMFNGPTSTALNVAGTYGIFADAVRQVARAHGLLPSQLQAIIWTHWQTTDSHRGYREDFPDPPMTSGVEAKAKRASEKRQARARVLAEKKRREMEGR